MTGNVPRCQNTIKEKTQFSHPQLDVDVKIGSLFNMLIKKKKCISCLRPAIEGSNAEIQTVYGQVVCAKLIDQLWYNQPAGLTYDYRYRLV